MSSKKDNAIENRIPRGSRSITRFGVPPRLQKEQFSSRGNLTPGSPAKAPRFAPEQPQVRQNARPKFGVAPQLRKKKVPLGAELAPISGLGAFPNFSYHGGPVVSNAQVYAIFLGDWTSAGDQDRATRLNQFLNDFLNSKYMNILSQYGCGSGGRLIKSVFVPNANRDLSNNDIQNILQKAINAGTIPEPTNPSNVYILYLDDATGVKDPGTSIIMCEASNDNAFGYHNYFTTTANNPCYYAVVPGLTDTCLENSCPSDNACSLHLSETQEQRQTQVTSHEFSEMVSDPQLNAWYDPSAGENGDICNGRSGTITIGSNSWTVQLMYSKTDDVNSDGATTCIAESPNPLPNLLNPQIASFVATNELPANVKGTAISVEGQNFTPGGQVEVTIRHAAKHLGQLAQGTVTVNQNGSFNWGSLRVPRLPCDFLLSATAIDLNSRITSEADTTVACP